ncbi:hypothetical protein XENOCAPTIV_025942, partial [Xenoophorus captivus]
VSVLLPVNGMAHHDNALLIYCNFPILSKWVADKPYLATFCVSSRRTPDSSCET